MKWKCWANILYPVYSRISTVGVLGCRYYERTLPKPLNLYSLVVKYIWKTGIYGWSQFDSQPGWIGICLPTPNRQQQNNFLSASCTYSRYLQTRVDWWLLGGGFKGFLNVHPYLGKVPNLTMFQMGWNHQLYRWFILVRSYFWASSNLCLMA